MKKQTLLVIANTTKAKIYDVNGHEYSLNQELNHPQSRLKSHDLITDKPGHYKSNHSTHGQFIPHGDAHEAEHVAFAKTVTDFINNTIERHHDHALIICAEPHFYGLLNKSISKTAKNAIIKVVEKDYIPLPEANLNDVIQKIIH